MIEHTADVRHIIDRMDLPKRFAKMIARIEEETRPLNDVDPKASAEISRALALVGGDGLMQCIVARMLEHMPEEEEGVLEPTDRIRSKADKWEAAAADHDNLTLLLIDTDYVAFDQAAERIAEGAGAHTYIEGRRTMVSLPVDKQPDWVAKLQQAQLDVTLACETTDGYDTIDVLDIGRDPLDHDHDGHKGGSEKGDQSTAHKGAIKRKSATKKKPKVKAPAEIPAG